MSINKNARNKIISVIVIIIIAAMIVGLFVWYDYTHNDKKNVMKHLQEYGFITRFNTITNIQQNIEESRTYYFGISKTGKMTMSKKDNNYRLELTSDGKDVYLEIIPTSQSTDSSAQLDGQNTEKMTYKVAYLTPETFIANMAVIRRSTSDLILTYGNRTVSSCACTYTEDDTDFKCYVAETKTAEIVIVSDRLYDTSHATDFALTVGGMVFMGQNTSQICSAPKAENIQTINSADEIRSIAADYGFNYDKSFNESAEQTGSAIDSSGN